jgi:hypothetical protein
VIVRLLLWRLADASVTVEDVHDLIGALAPLDPPSTWLWNGAQERFGLLLIGEGSSDAPPQLAAVRGLMGRDPDLFDEFDAFEAGGASGGRGSWR